MAVKDWQDEVPTEEAGQAHRPGQAPAARHRKAALGWIVILLLIAGLAAIFWPRLALLMRSGADPVAPPGAIAAAPATGPVAAKQPRHDYPPCTAQRTDSCVQRDGK